MNFKTLLAGIAFFQKKLAAFIDKADTKNKIESEKVLGMQAKIDERVEEIRKAKIIQKNINDLFDSEE